jgi:hypothetical protein
MCMLNEWQVAERERNVVKGQDGQSSSDRIIADGP